MTTTPRQSSVRHALWRGTPVALTILIGIGYLIGATLIDGGSASEEHPWLLGLLIFAQAGALLGLVVPEVVLDEREEALLEGQVQ